MNFGELVEASIAQVISLTATDQLVNANKNFAKAMVNKAYHTIERRTLWKFSEAEDEITAVAGEREASGVPTDMAIPVGIYSHASKCELAYHDERQRFFNQDEVGQVQHYGIWKGDLRFFPIPRQAETFTLRYYMKWPDLVSDLDVPIIPETWHDILMDFASGQLAMRLPPTGDRFLPYSRAQPWIETANARIEEMANSDLVMKTWDAVPNYGYEENVLGLGEW